MLVLNARKNQKLYLTQRQVEIITGCLLGDAYITKRGQIQIAHSIKQERYVSWKYGELRNISYGNPTKASRYDCRYNKHYIQIRFWTRQYFRTWRNEYYPRGIKIFPVKFRKYISDLALAVWYMDDGNLYNRRHVKIATDSFDDNTIAFLRGLLLSRFKLETTVNYGGKIRIASKSLDNFFSIVRPHIHSSMRYKIP